MGRCKGNLSIIPCKNSIMPGEFGTTWVSYSHHTSKTWDSLGFRRKLLCEDFHFTCYGLLHARASNSWAGVSVYQSLCSIRNPGNNLAMPMTNATRIKPGIYHVLGQAPKRYASQFYQPKAEHGAVGVFVG